MTRFSSVQYDKAQVRSAEAMEMLTVNTVPAAKTGKVCQNSIACLSVSIARNTKTFADFLSPIHLHRVTLNIC